MSCNGCRVLRKGCSEDCPLRPSLQWIKSADSQANATLFLAKFYGRAGLLNLINAASPHQRPEIFQSLLYEACGRIISPVHGSAGLMRTGDWKRCQAAVDAVLNGGPIESRDSAAANSPASLSAPFHGCDIRHLSAFSQRRPRTRRRGKAQAEPAEINFPPESEPMFTITGWSAEPEVDRRDSASEGSGRAASHDSFSVETVELSLMNRVENPCHGGFLPVSVSAEIGLDLTLGPARVADD